MPLAEEFKKYNKVPGVYIISPDYSPTINRESKIVVKIGYASNLKTRLNDYHTCYRESFYTYSLIETSSPQSAKMLEKKIHDRLKKFGYQYEAKEYMARDSKRGNEWFSGKKRLILHFINEVLKESNFNIKIHNLHNHYFYIVNR